MDYKYLILFIGTLSVLVAYSSAAPAARAADPEYDDDAYDDEGAAPPAAQPAQPAPKPVVPVRHGALLNRRNPLAGNGRSIGGNKIGQAAATTSTTQAPVSKEEEFVDENEEELAGEVSSTTESPKKLKGIRPFRSNDDLLAALKRRREQAAGHKSSNPKPSSAEANEAPAPVETSTKGKLGASANGGRRRYSPSKSNNEAAPPATEEQTPAPVRAGRRFSPRS